MPSKPLVRSFLVLWWVVGGVLLVASAETAWHAAAGSLANPHIVLLGSVEALSALLFLLPRTMRIGAAGLGLTLLVAILVHLTRRDVRLDLILYGAAVLFVAVHGTLSADQWRLALRRPART
jgi:uncharacterized membrane protein YphA (DoxX/SURF4 family)